MKWIVAALFMVGCVVVFVSRSRGDDVVGPELQAPPPSTNPAPSYAGSSARHEPFTPYDPGPANQLWTYDRLSPEEKQAIDTAKANNQWAAINAASDPVTQEAADQAAAGAAEHQMGLDDSSSTGVVP